MRTLAFTAQKGGINRQRVKGGAKADTLYDLVNGFVTGARTVANREGTVRDAVLAATTRGLTAFAGLLHTFSHQMEDYTPVGYLANVLAHPDSDSEATLHEIHFAQPFMGALYVVAEWSDGGIYHYWLASSGEWEAATVYKEGDVVVPTTLNGLLYKAVPNNPAAPTQTWQRLTNYAVGDKILPTEYNGFYYEVIATQGDVPISGAFEPAWEASEGAEIVESADGTGAPAATSSADATPQVPPDVRDRYGTGNTEISAASAAAIGLSDNVPAWSPGTLYTPGSLVKPLSVAPVINSAIPNANFEDGDTGWSKDTGWSITNTVYSGHNGKPYQGAWYARWDEAAAGGSGWRYLEMSTTVPVVPGQFLSASCYDMRSGGGSSGVNGQIVLLWYDAYDALIKETGGTSSGSESSKDYRAFTVQDVTPGGATKVRVAYKCSQKGGPAGFCSIDSFTWDYVNLTPVQADFTVYQAVQAAAGNSGTQEPAWPGPGNQVVDNEVTWLGGVTSVITWRAVPIMKSGSTEPTWAEQAGSSTPDGTVSWLATTGYVEQAPNSKLVTLAAKKVFTGDGDIVPFSATVNPLDWTTEEDAGYLPTGLHPHGANPVAALGTYRGNLVPFNSAGLQMWQVDPDPELMQLLDAIPVGSTYHKALQPVKNDLLFLTQLGVRSLGIAGASTNLEAGDIGDPVDSLVEAALQAGTYEPRSLYYPARGQYWLLFGPQAFVCTLNDEGRSWSRYVFPEAITDSTLLGNDLYLRTATHKVWKLDREALADDFYTTDNVYDSTGSPSEKGGSAGDYQASMTTPTPIPVGDATVDITYWEYNQATNDLFRIESLSSDVPLLADFYHTVVVKDGGGNVLATLDLADAVSSGPYYGLNWTVAGLDFSAVATIVLEFTGDPTVHGTAFDGTLWWPSLDLGNMGVTKQLDSFDLVCKGEVSVQFGYDQRDPTVLTAAYTLDGDTLPGTSIPFPFSAPSFAPKLTFTGGQEWEWMAMNLYVQDSRGAGFAG